MVEVGYQKGAEQVGASLILNVVSVPGTASEQIYIKYFSELYSSILCLTFHVTLIIIYTKFPLVTLTPQNLITDVVLFRLWVASV